MPIQGVIAELIRAMPKGGLTSPENCGTFQGGGSRTQVAVRSQLLVTQKCVVGPELERASRVECSIYECSADQCYRSVAEGDKGRHGHQGLNVAGTMVDRKV